jgi:hypothetical protein
MPNTHPHRTCWPLAARAFALLGLLALAACDADNGAPSVKLVETKGKVALKDGAPLGGGLIYLVPTKDGREAYGKISADGAFTVETDGRAGAVPGDYRVRIEADQTNLPTASGKKNQVRLPFDRKYLDESTSGLTASVKPDSPNQIDIHLQ